MRSVEQIIAAVALAPQPCRHEAEVRPQRIPSAECVYISISRSCVAARCNAIQSANCDCGVGYVPAGKRAEEAVAANPQMSDRAIADEIGESHRTVNRARKATGTKNDPVADRTGRDGKQRAARKAKAKRFFTNVRLCSTSRSSLAGMGAAK